MSDNLQDVVFDADPAAAFPGTQAQLDLLTVVARIRQLKDEAWFDSGHYLWERIANCDLPRLEALLAPEVLAWMDEQEAGWRKHPVRTP